LPYIGDVVSSVKLVCRAELPTVKTPFMVAQEILASKYPPRQWPDISLCVPCG
jgi:hypothetical protein